VEGAVESAWIAQGEEVGEEVFEFASDELRLKGALLFVLII